MASPLNATQGLLQKDGNVQSHRQNEEYDTFNGFGGGTFLDFSADSSVEVVIPQISEAFNKYDTFEPMKNSAWNTMIGLDFYMNEAQWNYDSNDRFKTKKCGFVMKGW